MGEAELDFKERNHLWNLCIASFLVVFFSYLVWSLFLEQVAPLSGWKIIFWGVPFSIITPVSFFLPYEVFYPKRVRKSPLFHLKRFFRRTLSMIAVILVFTATTSYSDVSFSKTLGDQAWFPGFGLCLAVFIIATLVWLSHQGSRDSQS
jgi:magnesium-transporting ATPase (P-type)